MCLPFFLCEWRETGHNCYYLSNNHSANVLHQRCLPMALHFLLTSTQGFSVILTLHSIQLAYIQVTVFAWLFQLERIKDTKLTYIYLVTNSKTLQKSTLRHDERRMYCQAQKSWNLSWSHPGADKTVPYSLGRCLNATYPDHYQRTWKLLPVFSPSQRHSIAANSSMEYPYLFAIISWGQGFDLHSYNHYWFSQAHQIPSLSFLWGGSELSKLCPSRF